MRLLAKIFLLSSLMLPARLVAADVIQERDSFGIGDDKSRYFTVYGAYPAFTEYDLTGNTEDGQMDVIKMKRDFGLGIGGAFGYEGISGWFVEIQGEFNSGTDKIKSVELKKGGGDKFAGHPSKIDVSSFKGLIKGKYVFSLFTPEELEETQSDSRRLVIDVKPYIEAAGGFAYDIRKIKDIVVGSTGASGAKLSATDETNLKKFDKGELSFIYRAGFGADITLDTTVWSLGYNCTMNVSDHKLSQNVQNKKKYEIEVGKNVIHSIELGTKFLY